MRRVPPPHRRVDHRGLALLASCRPRRAALVTLAGWTALEAVPSGLSGLSVARAVDAFRAGAPARAAGWLAALALGIALGALATRRLYAALAPTVEGTRDRLMTAVVRGSVADLADSGRPGSAPLTQLVDQIDQVRNLLSALARNLRGTVAPLVPVFVGLVLLDPALAFAVAGPLAVAVLLYAALLRPLVRAQRLAAEADETLGGTAVSALTEPSVLRGLGAERWAVSRVHFVAELTARADVRVARLHAMRHVVIAVGGYLPLLTLLLVAQPLLREGRVTIGDVAGATTYVLTALLPALSASVTGSGGWFVQLAVLLDRLAAVADRPDPRPVAPPTVAAPDLALASAGATFEYRPGARPILAGLDLAVAPGQLVVVVGPSGAGKSTLAHLFAGLLRPSDGHLGVGGGARLVLLPQTPYVVSGSFRENLTYLAPGEVTDQQARLALDVVGLTAVVDASGGLDAPALRERAHGGQRLSDGERQRLVLARAWLSGAEVLVVDEGWSGLDPEAREQVERRLRDSGRTLVVITHDLGLAPRADLVLYFDGRDVTAGPHADLLSRCASYRELVAFAAAAEPAPAGAGAALG